MRRTITLLVLLALVTACDKPSSPPAAGHARAKVLQPPVAADGSKATPLAAGALARWQKRLDQLLPAGEIAELTGMPPNTMPDAARPDRLRYQWDTGRTFEYAGTRIRKKSLVSLGPIRTGSNADTFAALHFNPPDEQQRARLKQEVARQAERRNLDEHSTTVVHQLSETIVLREPAERIKQLGDAAAWATGGGDPTLYVLIGDATFALTVNVSNDPAANRDTAVALARRVIGRATGDASR